MRGPPESFRDSQEVDKNPFKFLTPDFPKLDRVRGRGVLGTKEVRGYNVSPLQAESSTGWGRGGLLWRGEWVPTTSFHLWGPAGVTYQLCHRPLNPQGFPDVV